MDQVDLDNSELNMLQENTNLNPALIVSYYKMFLAKYPNGRITKSDFIQDIILKLIVDHHKLSPECEKCKIDPDLYQEKIKLSERLFDICDQDESGSVDFAEVSFIMKLIRNFSVRLVKIVSPLSILCCFGPEPKAAR